MLSGEIKRVEGMNGMRRRMMGFAVLLLGLMLVVVGCGKKDAGAVVKDLDKKVGGLESYSTSGTMVLNTGIEPQEYQVEVWYQKPSYYRIALTNAKQDISQIVLKNDDGVFVLTPHLNKSFRFQSEWPENQGQVYLYQSLVQSISMDQERNFTTDGESYVFDVLANYSNASLARQKIWVNQKTYAPQHVEIYDNSNNALVVMNFTNFEFDKTFEKDSFDMQSNMTGGRIVLPTLGQADGKAATDKAGTADAGQKGTAANPEAKSSGTPAAASQEFSIVEPNYAPKGVGKPQISETKLGGNQAILLKYTGTYNYNLIESRPTDKSASFQDGNLIDLGYSFGVLTGGEKKTLIWMYQGTEFRLSSGDLPEAEMVKIAIAVQDQSAK
jgi:outer membrane lipoprotein-sorting protein